MKTRIFLFASACCFLLIMNPAQAIIRHVPAQYPTIQAAIDAASDGDTVLVEPGTYYEHIEILIKGLTLSSNFIFTGDESFIGNTIIDAFGSNYPAIKIINSGSKTSLFGITLQNSNSSISGGGVHSQGSTLIDHCVIRNNISVSSGGGIYYFGSDSELEITNCIIENNTSHGEEGGGGIYINDGSTNYVSIKNNIIRNNIVSVYYHGNDYGVEAYGGGIADWSTTTNLTLWHNIICNNQVNVTTDYDSIPVGAIARGGGIYCRYECVLSAYNCLISGNSCYANALDTTETAEGGGIYTWSCILINSTITGNMVSVESGPAGQYGGIRAGSTDGYNNIIFDNIPLNGSTGFSNSFYNDPLFIKGLEGNYYLSQFASGQLQQSPCVNAGAWASWIGGTTRNDGFPDDNLTDIGFHYPSGMLKLSLTNILQGPFNGVNMNCDLSGNNLIPLSQPFNTAPWFYYGNESISSVPSHVTDWVLVELRQLPGHIIGRKGAFITADGKITGLDGNQELPFTFGYITFSDSLYIVVRQRNHLAIMSSQPMEIINSVFSYNFTTSATQIHGGILGCRELASGVWGMVSGDGNGDGAVNNQDKINVWQLQTPGSGYLGGDFNLDGQVNNVDKIVQWSPNGGWSSQVPGLTGPPQLIETHEVTDINATSAISGGNVPFEGGAPVSSKGICWNTLPDPIISNSHTDDGVGLGPFTSQLTGLVQNTYYYVRAYATNSFGTSYGNQISFSTFITCPGIPNISYEGQTYNTVQVGSQCWLRENLNVGAMIQGSQAQSDNGIKEKYCYDNDTANCTAYGGLYQWNEAMQYSTNPGAQGICPPGWHVPTDAEWCTLSTFIDPSVNCSSFGWSGTDAGTKMKSVSGWASGNGTNISGLTVLPAGFADSFFSGCGQYTAFWSSSLLNNLALYRSLSAYYTKICRSTGLLTKGYSIRCLRD